MTIFIKWVYLKGFSSIARSLSKFRCVCGRCKMNISDRKLRRRDTMHVLNLSEPMNRNVKWYSHLYIRKIFRQHINILHIKKRSCLLFSSFFRWSWFPWQLPAYKKTMEKMRMVTSSERLHNEFHCTLRDGRFCFIIWSIKVVFKIEWHTRRHISHN